VQRTFATHEIADLLGAETRQVRRLFEDGTLTEPPRCDGQRAIPAELVPAIIRSLAARGWVLAEPRRTKVTPPQLAREWRISPDKVLQWIRSGELPAINGAAEPNGRPRYLIDQADVELFEAARRVVPKKPSPIRARHSGPAKFTKFF
jgi:hypothetical protein